MAERLVTVLILSSIFVHGKMFKEGEEVEVNEREAKELIGRGVATDETEVEVIEDRTVSLEEMKKDELFEYAASIGIDFPSNITKAEMIEIINGEEE